MYKEIIFSLFTDQLNWDKPRSKIWCSNSGKESQRKNILEDFYNQHIKARVAGLDLKEASTKGLVFLRQDESWLTALCQTQSENHQ